MPFTPFHFGPGLLVKAVAPRAFSLATFVVVQVVIDLETLYHLLRREWPVHRVLHTLVGGTAVGLAVGVVAWRVGSAFIGRARSGGSGSVPVGRASRAELSFTGTLLGGVVGGASHSLLDGMMHADVRPYWPFSTAPGWLGLVSVGTLHLGCLLAGVLGAGILWLAARRRGPGVAS